MINLIETPQRSDYVAEYTVANDALTVTMGEVSEIFDFSELPEGEAEVSIQVLPITPIVGVEKIGDTVNVTVINFYGEDEKDLFES